MANTEAASPSGHSGGGAIRPAWRSVRRATCNSETLRRGRSLPREYGAKSRLRPASASKLNAVHARTSRAILKFQHALITWHGHDGRQDTSSKRAQTLMGSEAQARKLSRVLVSAIAPDGQLLVLASARRRCDGHGSTRLGLLSVSQWTFLFHGAPDVQLLSVEQFKRLQATAQENK